MSGRRVSALVVATATAAALFVGAAALPAAAVSVGTDTVSDEIARQEAAERATRVTRSLFGVRPSAYIGPFYNARYERTRQCIVRRESGGNYTILSPGGTYRGAYQFNQVLGDYAATQMQRPDLVGKSVARWSRFEQDKAFWLVWNHGKGASHWGGGAWHC